MTRNEYNPDVVSPPGETLKEIMANRELTPRDVAIQAGCSIECIEGIIQGTISITNDLAWNLARVFGTAFSAAFWLKRERAYRKFLAHQLLRVSLDKNRGYRYP